MKGLTLRQLRYFEALARQGHFGRAAEVSSVSQPALSMQISQLEARFGTPLFERGARQVRLTGFGQEVAVRVREILSRVDELTELAKAAETGLAGQLRLGVIPTVAPYILPALVADLTARHPGLDLRIRETQTTRLVAELTDGRLDAAPGKLLRRLRSEANLRSDLNRRGDSVVEVAGPCGSFCLRYEHDEPCLLRAA